MNLPIKRTPEETLEVYQTLPHQQKIHGITIHDTGEPTTTRWYTDGLKRHGRAGRVIYNGTYRAAFRVHGPQQVYRAETTPARGPLNWPDKGTTSYSTTKVWFQPLL